LPDQITHAAAGRQRRVVQVSACAKQPEAVAPAQIDQRPMMQFPCSNLRQKEQQGEVTVESLSAKQKTAADNCALGVFLLGLPLPSMSGNDPEMRLSIAKGQLNAVRFTKAEEGCRESFPLL
jgi:hypothetical protein